MIYNKNTTESFWSRVSTDKADDCWIWPGRPHERSGYGRFNFDGKQRYAHRTSWTLTFGAIPEGLFVLHKCDVRMCVNPSHLFLGTALDNAADMMAKGRYPRERLRYHGEDHKNSIVTASQVLEIRRDAGFVSWAKLAQRYAVSATTIGRIIKRETWKHL